MQADKTSSIGPLKFMQELESIPAKLEVERRRNLHLSIVSDTPQRDRLDSLGYLGAKGMRYGGNEGMGYVTF